MFCAEREHRPQRNLIPPKVSFKKMNIFRGISNLLEHNFSIGFGKIYARQNSVQFLTQFVIFLLFF